jgi:hypothetical protein
VDGKKRREGICGGRTWGRGRRLRKGREGSKGRKRRRGRKRERIEIKWLSSAGGE